METWYPVWPVLSMSVWTEGKTAFTIRISGPKNVAMPTTPEPSDPHLIILFEWFTSPKLLTHCSSVYNIEDPCYELLHLFIVFIYSMMCWSLKFSLWSLSTGSTLIFLINRRKDVGGLESGNAENIHRNVKLWIILSQQWIVQIIFVRVLTWAISLYQVLYSWSIETM